MKLLLAVPLPPNPLVDVRMAAWSAALSRNPQVEWQWAQNMTPDEGRNALIWAGLQDPDVTHFFFLDSDTVPPARAVQELMDLGQPVACGLTPILVRGRILAWNVRMPDGVHWWPAQRPLPAGPFKTRHVGGTTVLVERQVVEKIPWPWFERKMAHPSTGDPCQMSGDVAFSEAVGAAGFDIWAHPNVRCSHWKMVDLLALMGGQIADVREEAFAGASSVRPPDPAPGPAGGFRIRTAPEITAAEIEAAARSREIADLQDRLAALTAGSPVTRGA